MKFNVRPGFVVHHVTVVEVQQNGQTVRQEQQNSYWEGQTVDFTADEARQHMHKLEPADKTATAFLESQVLSNVQATGAASIDAGILAAAIAQALALHAQAAAVANSPAA